MDLHPELVNVSVVQSHLKILADQKRMAPIIARAAAYLLATDGDRATLEKVVEYASLTDDEKEFVVRAAEDIWGCFAIEEDLVRVTGEWFDLDRDELNDCMRLYFLGEETEVPA